MRDLQILDVPGADVVEHLVHIVVDHAADLLHRLGMGRGEAAVAGAAPDLMGEVQQGHGPPDDLGVGRRIELR